MSKQSHASSPIYSFADGSREIRFARRACPGMRWSWNHYADEIWQQLDPKLWEITQNPWIILQTVSRDQMQRVLANPAFRKKVDILVKIRREAAEAPAWFQNNYQQASLSCVAYFRGRSRAAPQARAGSRHRWMAAAPSARHSARSLSLKRRTRGFSRVRMRAELHQTDWTALRSCPWPSRERATSSLPTPRWPQVLTGSRPTTRGSV